MRKDSQTFHIPFELWVGHCNIFKREGLIPATKDGMNSCAIEVSSTL